MNASQLSTVHLLPATSRPASKVLAAEEPERNTPIVVTLLDATEPLDASIVGRADARATDALRGWLFERLDVVELSAMLAVAPRALLQKSFERSQVLILRRPTRSTSQLIAGMLNDLEIAPEIILIDAPHPVPDELREAGVAVAFHLRAESSTECVGQAILDTLRIHVPLRESCQRAVGRLPLRDTLALVRLYMLREAFRKTRSKRGAARELGVTRPAVQQMLRGPTPRDQSLASTGRDRIEPLK
jgi:hypothetical protein